MSASDTRWASWPRSFEATPIDDNCSLCGAPTTLTYRDGWLFLSCTACEGFFGDREDFPPGTNIATTFDPGGAAGREPLEMLRAARLRAQWAFECSLEGVCNTCSGPIEARLDCCPDHASDGVCPTCERRKRAMAQFTCPVCKQHRECSPWGACLLHPAVVAFFYDRDVLLTHSPAGVGEPTRASR
ncbi:hypothetical protein ACFO0N_04990 [Halobium salinum]|uniref:DUF7351 domain-containing protein n=1 Tax=Halobium salinum TaxID=1364940 RepID=A0ABD5P9C7_9EURY|nr:hypothetical protein [Halobium salinum]